MFSSNFFYFIFILFLFHFYSFTLNLNFCPDGITPNSGLTGPNNTHTHTHTHIYIYIYIYSIYIYIYIYIMLPCQHGSPWHSRHPSLSSIAPGRSSMLYPVSLQGCCRKVLAGRSPLARPCKGVHGSTLLMSSSLLL